MTQPGAALRVGYAVHPETGELLYWSERTDDATTEWPKLATRRNLRRAEMPSGLLNEGSYRITLLTGLDEGDWAVHPGTGAPSVTLDVHSGFGDWSRWTGRRQALIAPLARWVRADPVYVKH